MADFVDSRSMSSNNLSNLDISNYELVHTFSSPDMMLQKSECSCGLAHDIPHEEVDDPSTEIPFARTPEEDPNMRINPATLIAHHKKKKQKVSVSLIVFKELDGLLYNFRDVSNVTERGHHR
jgi:hypothetical protein